jgi:uncharacterized membrane-anchored protein YhcB (DUF1043 family)
MTLLYILISFLVGAAGGVIFHARITKKLSDARAKAEKELLEEVEKLKAKLSGGKL